MAGTSKRPTSRQRNVSGAGKPVTPKKSAGGGTAAARTAQGGNTASKQTLPKAKKPAGAGAQTRMGAQNTRARATWEKITRENGTKKPGMKKRAQSTTPRKEPSRIAQESRLGATNVRGRAIHSDVVRNEGAIKLGTSKAAAFSRRGWNDMGAALKKAAAKKK